MKLRNATTADAARLDTLLTRLIHDEVQYDSNLNGSYVVTDNYRDRIGLEGHKLLLIEDGGEIVAFLYGFLYEIPGMLAKPIAILDALYIAGRAMHRSSFLPLSPSRRKTAPAASS